MALSDSPDPKMAPGGRGGIEATRVAQLVVRGSAAARGSGYRVTAGLVLTAGHVLAGADEVIVRFLNTLTGTGQEFPATAWWQFPRSDIGLVRIEPDPDEEVPAVRYGRIGAGTTGVFIQAVGFPRWKLRYYETSDEPGAAPFRDVAHVSGSIPPLANLFGKDLEILVEGAPAQDPDPHRSPWEGMSGAAVWVGDRIVGVVTNHYPREGLQRLTATRLDRALDELNATAEPAPTGGTGAAGHGAIDDIIASLPFPPNSRQLADVAPEPVANRLANVWATQLADIGPGELLGRETELEEVVRFCAGNDSYLWWQAGPWAGKTALLSSVARNPPAGVDVVWFFITSRLAGQADSNAFTSALVEQLAAVLGEDPAALSPTSASHGQLLRLLSAAAERSAEVGRRLLLVVDGLDEDRSNAGDLNLASIASLLPRNPHPSLRVLVASRPHPELPLDVGEAHPLRVIRPRQLKPSEYASGLERHAKQELRGLLRGHVLQRAVLSLLTAAGGGLTSADLAELTQAAPGDVEDVLDGQLGRSVSSRVSAVPGPGGTEERVYLFAHEQLRELAEQQLGHAVDSDRDRLCDWADRYRDRGWPRETPAYLLRGYSRMLTSIGIRDRLVALAIDSARHARLLDRTGSDMLALDEVHAAAAISSQPGSIDFAAVLRLAMIRDDLIERNRNLPIGLPAAWAAVGQTVRAITLTNAIDQEHGRVAAVCAVIRVLGATGEVAAAAALAAAAEEALVDVRYYVERDRALGELATAVAAAGDYGGAAHIAWDVQDHAARAKIMNELVVAMVRGGHLDLAAEFVDTAERTVAELSGNAHTEALQGLLAAAAAMHDGERMCRIVVHVREPRALLPAMRILGAEADFGTADQCASRIPDDVMRIQAFAELAISARAEHPEVGRAYLVLAMDQVATIRHPGSRAAAQRAVDAADMIYRDRRPGDTAVPIGHEPERSLVLVELATLAAKRGAYDDADQFARQLPHVHGHRLRLQLACLAASAGHSDEVLRRAGQTEPARNRVQLLLQAAHDAPQEVAARLLGAAISATDGIPDGTERATAQCEVAVALAAAGRVPEATELATTVESAARHSVLPLRRDASLAILAGALWTHGERDRALALRRLIAQPEAAAALDYDFAAAAAQAGDDEWLRSVIAGIDDSRVADQLLTRLALAAGTSRAPTTEVALIKDSRLRATVVARLSRAAARDKRIESITPLLDLLGPGPELVGILRDTSEVLLAGKHARAMRAVAERVVDRVQRPHLRVAALSVAAVLDRSRQGHYLESAEELCRQIANPDERRLAAESLVDAARRVGDTARAQRLENHHGLKLGTFQRFGGSFAGPGWLNPYLVPLDDLGDSIGGRPSAERPTRPSIATRPIERIADVFPDTRVRSAVQRGEPQRAEQIANGLAAEQRIASLCWLADEAVRRGDFGRAERLARGLGVSNRQVIVDHLIEAAVVARDFDRVNRLAESLGSSPALQSALERIAREPSEAANRRDALRSVHDIIVRGLLALRASGETLDEIICSVITTPAWRSGVSAVAVVAIETLRTLSDDLITAGR